MRPPTSFPPTHLYSEWVAKLIQRLPAAPDRWLPEPGLGDSYTVVPRITRQRLELLVQQLNRKVALFGKPTGIEKNTHIWSAHSQRTRNKMRIYQRRPHFQKFRPDQ